MLRVEPATQAPSVAVNASSPEARAREVERAYERHHAQVYQTAVRFGGGRRGWAEDVAQDVFMTLFDRIDQLDAHDDLAGWLYRVTVNACLKRLRRERWIERWASWLPLAPRVERDPETTVVLRGELRAAIHLVDDLPPKERVAFAMYYFDEKPIEEIANLLGHSKGYASKLVSRAETKVRQRSQKWR